MSKKSKRSSTKFTFNVGYVLVVLAVVVVIYGLSHGIINATNIVDVLWALLLGAASFLGVNLARVATENVAKINNGIDPESNSSIKPESPVPGDTDSKNPPPVP